MRDGADPDWNILGLDWPNRTASRFVRAAGLNWHVQELGQGEPMLLVHGTGASTHSWRDLAPRLAQRYRIIAPDLPGHGFTRCADPERLSLPGMAQALGALLETLHVAPVWAVGHSAGAAILVRMALDGTLRPRRIISLNGALLPLGGLRSPLFAPLARLFVSNPVMPRLFAWQASQPAAFARMMDQTGSRLDARGIELYQRLATRPAHVGAALDMMARWDVRPLERQLPQLPLPLTLVSGGRDGMIPPAHADDVRRLLPTADSVTFDDLGHLAHEEQPERVAAFIESRCTA